MELAETQRVRANRNAWKAQLAKDIINLEDNLDQIYINVGLKAHRIVQDDQTDEIGGDIGRGTNARLRPNEPATNNQKFETIVDEHFVSLIQSARNICNLISSVTEFDLPIPVYVILRLASRIGSIRWSDYKKKISGSMVQKYIYSKSHELIRTSLMVYSCISAVLGTNIIPFQPFINQNIMNILEWTRTSDLFRHNQAQYFSIRSQVFSNITRAIQQLSLNLNLESKQLKTLIESELLHDIEELTKLFVVEQQHPVPTLTTHHQPNNHQLQQQQQEPQDKNHLTKLKDMYAIDTMSCLEQIFVNYTNFLDTSLEYKIKNFVVQTCIRIYRDFEKNVIGLACRRQLLCLLETIANSPHSTSTTELAWHVFELASMHESDPDIRYQTKRALKIGLAHRPTVVSHHDVYECYGRPMTSIPMEDKESNLEALPAREKSITPPLAIASAEPSSNNNLGRVSDGEGDETIVASVEGESNNLNSPSKEGPSKALESENNKKLEHEFNREEEQRRQEQQVDEEGEETFVDVTIVEDSEGEGNANSEHVPEKEKSETLSQERQQPQQQDRKDSQQQQEEQLGLDQTIFVLSPNGTVTEKALGVEMELETENAKE